VFGLCAIHASLRSAAAWHKAKIVTYKSVKNITGSWETRKPYPGS